MRSVAIIGSVAVTVESWEESQADGTRETGCRVQLRRVRDVTPPIPPPIPRRDAVFWSVEDPIWRADLFSVVGGGVPFDAAHFHPTFTGLVPCERVGDPALEADPLGWIERRLADLPGMLIEAGHPELVDGLDPGQPGLAMPSIRAMIDAALAP